jgi:hypothetical protein
MTATPDRPPVHGSSRSLLHQALAAAARGWPVHPLRPYAKRPTLRDWERRASTDLDQLARWWTLQPAANIGIACGPAGLLVLDLDAGHGQPPPPRWAERGATGGADVLAMLAADAGQPVPTGTYTVATPSGHHLYFTRPAGTRLPNTAGRLGWRIDTRGQGGYVVAAGSVLRAGRHQPTYRVLHDIPVAPLPDWITDALTRTDTPTVQTMQARPWHQHAYVRAALTGEARTVAQARPGTRNQTLFRAAASLGELLGAGLLDHTTATDTLIAAARPHIGVAGFTQAEAHRTIANGLARGRRNPRFTSSHEHR